MERLRGAITAGALLLLGVLAHAETPQAVFKQAHDAYANGQFAQAATLYESAREQGLNNWVLYYDLGNAYYKSGSTGKAVVNYLRAFRLNSGQRDVIYNLNLALTKAGDPFIPQEALARLFWKLFYTVPLNLLTILVSLLFIGLCVGGSLGLLGKWRPDGEPAAIVLGVFLVLGAWMGMRVSLYEKHQAVVVSGIAEVRSAPSLSDPANFTVPEGRRVLILEEQEPVKGWIEIGVPQEGLKGWVPDNAVEAI